MRSVLVVLAFSLTTIFLFYKTLFIKEPASLLYYILPFCMAVFVWHITEVIATFILCLGASVFILLFSAPKFSLVQLLPELLNLSIYLLLSLFIIDILKERLRISAKREEKEVPFSKKVFEGLTSFCKAMNSQEEIDYIQEDIKRTLNHIIEVHGANSCMIFIKDEEEFKKRFAAGDTKEAEKILNGSLGLEMKNYITRTGEEIIIPNVLEDPRYRSFGERPLKSLLCAPIILQGSVVGLFYVDFAEKELKEEEIEPLLLYNELFGILFSKEILLMRLKESAIFDEKTGLLSYKYFDQRLEEEISRARRYGKELALMLVNLSGEGLFLSDEDLRNVAQIFRRNIRHADIVAHYTNSSFMVLLVDTQEELASLTAERLKDAITKHFLPKKVIVSIGLVRYKPTIYDKDGFLKKVESIIEKAKEAGGAIIMD